MGEPMGMDGMPREHVGGTRWLGLHLIYEVTLDFTKILNS